LAEVTDSSARTKKPTKRRIPGAAATTLKFYNISGPDLGDLNSSPRPFNPRKTTMLPYSRKLSSPRTEDLSFERKTSRKGSVQDLLSARDSVCPSLLSSPVLERRMSDRSISSQILDCTEPTRSRATSISSQNSKKVPVTETNQYVKILNPTEPNMKLKCLGFLANKSESVIAYLENMGISKRGGTFIRGNIVQNTVQSQSQTARQKTSRSKTPLLTQRSSVSNVNSDMQGYNLFTKRTSTGSLYSIERKTYEQPKAAPIGMVAAKCLSYNKLKYPIKPVFKSEVIASRIAKITPCPVRQIVTYKAEKWAIPPKKIN